VPVVEGSFQRLLVRRIDQRIVPKVSVPTPEPVRLPVGGIACKIALGLVLTPVLALVELDERPESDLCRVSVITYPQYLYISIFEHDR
jgi:hypothetical protein